MLALNQIQYVIIILQNIAIQQSYNRLIGIIYGAHKAILPKFEEYNPKIFYMNIPNTEMSKAIFKIRSEILIYRKNIDGYSEPFIEFPEYINVDVVSKYPNLDDVTLNNKDDRPKYDKFLLKLSEALLLDNSNLTNYYNRISDIILGGF